MIQVIILFLAILIDTILGDPPNRYHTTAWIGKVIGYLKPRLKSRDASKEVRNGALIAILIIAIVSLPLSIFSLFAEFNMIASVIIASILLKLTISIRSMEDHAMRVVDALNSNDIELARRELSMIVARDTSNLDKEHIISAVIESIGENTTDGITGALFYYSLFGITGAFAYRAINTLDAMLGYKDDYHKNIGYASAMLDTIANMIPSRLVAIITILSSILLRFDWRNAIRIIARDSKNTESLNAGWSMAGYAGALRIRLEKLGYYSIGDAHEQLDIEHCYKALLLMKVNALLFILLITLPLLIARVSLGLVFI